MPSYIKLFGLLAVTVFLFSSCEKDDEYFPGEGILGEYIGTTTVIEHKYNSLGHWVADTTVLHDKANVLRYSGTQLGIRFDRQDYYSPYYSQKFPFNPYEIGDYSFSIINPSESSGDGIFIDISAADKYLRFHSYRLVSHGDFDSITFEGWKK